EGGGRIIEDDQTVSVNNPQVIQAWERAARWVGTISPPGVVAYRETDAANAWSAGTVAFLRTWESSYFLRRFAGVPQQIVGRVARSQGVGVTSIPGGKAGRAGTLGGVRSGLARSGGPPKGEGAPPPLLPRGGGGGPRA